MPSLGLQVHHEVVQPEDLMMRSRHSLGRHSPANRSRQNAPMTSLVVASDETKLADVLTHPRRVVYADD